MSRLDTVIDEVFKDQASRAIARHWAAAFADQPMMANRIEPLLREAARSDAMVRDGTMSREQAEGYLLSFASDALGTPAHLVQAIQNWQPDPGLLPPDTEQSPQPEAAPAQSQPAPATAAPTRDQLRAQIEMHQRNMRSPEGSDAWRDYWQRGGRADYARALQAMETAVDAPPAQPAEPAA